MISIFSNKRRIYTVIEICALAGMIAFMFIFASKQSFWVDELDWMIGIITGKAVFNSRIHTGMFQILLEQGYNLPLYYIIEKPFYELMPYGEVFLLIPSIIFAVLGIVILKKAGTLIGGETMGFIAVCLAVTSTVLITQGGWNLRPYSITFCFSALTLFMYVKRLRSETGKHIILYGIALILLLFSHWFGSILALFYAFRDVCLYIRKKITLKCIFSYILAGAFIIPWFLLMVFHHTNNLSAYWGETPSVIAPIRIVYYLLSRNALYCLCFGIGFVIILFKGIKKNTEESSTIWFSMNIAIIWVIVPVLFYSKFINPSGSFYEDRYFFVLMPHIFLITGYGFLEVFRAVKGRFFTAEHTRTHLYCAVVLLFCVAYFQAYQKAYLVASRIISPYREGAEYLSKDSRVYTVNALVICSSSSSWIEYYFSKRGFTIPANVALYIPPASYQKGIFQLFVESGEYVQPVSLSVESLSKYDYIYLVEIHSAFTKEFISAIAETHTLAEERPEFANDPPKDSLLRRIILKDMFRPEHKQSFGLRLYAKTP